MNTYARILALPEAQTPFTIVKSRPHFDRIDGPPERAGSGRDVGIAGTHSAIGGDPWLGDWPLGYNKENDIRAAVDSDREVRTVAIGAGVLISQVPDYGYSKGIMPPGSPEEGTGRGYLWE